MRTFVDARVRDVHEQHRPRRMRGHDTGEPAGLREDDAVQAVDALVGHLAVCGNQTSTELAVTHV